MTSPQEDPGDGVPVAEVLFECVLPVVGTTLTMAVALGVGVPLGWALLFSLPGALAFQWAVVLILVCLAAVWPGRGKK